MWAPSAIRGYPRRYFTQLSRHAYNGRPFCSYLMLHFGGASDGLLLSFPTASLIFPSLLSLAIQSSQYLKNKTPSLSHFHSDPLYIPLSLSKLLSICH